MFPDKTIQSTLTADFDSIHTRSHGLEIPSTPELPEIMFSGAASGAVIVEPMPGTFEIAGSGISRRGGE